MNLHNKISTQFFFPLNDFLFKTNFTNQFNFLMSSQWWTKEKIEYYQNKKLQKLIHHCYTNVPFYRKIFLDRNLNIDDIKTVRDLYKLPIITKKVIRENMLNGSIVSQTLTDSSFFEVGSSGSTGEPLQYLISKNAYNFNTLCNLRGWHWMGYKLGDKYTKLSTNPLESGTKKIQNLIFRCMYISTNDLDSKKMLHLYKIWSQRRDIVIRGYPSILYIISKYFTDNNLHLPFSPTAINTTGEILFDYMRTSIEACFRCPVFDSYSGEAGSTVFQCEEGTYHISSEYAITEIVDDKDNVITKGKGRVVSTDLWNYAVPFLRYDVEDMVAFSNDNCKCGRGLPTLDSIDGRNVDILKTPSGKIVVVHFFTGYFEWVDSVDQFQIIQTSLDSFNLLLVINSKFSDEIHDKINEDLKNYLGDDVNLITNVVKDIPLAKSGKRRFVIRECNYEL